MEQSICWLMQRDVAILNSALIRSGLVQILSLVCDQLQIYQKGLISIIKGATFIRFIKECYQSDSEETVLCCVRIIACLVMLSDNLSFVQDPHLFV